MISLRALAVFKVRHKDEDAGKDSVPRLWLVRRFPTVEFRARKAGRPALPSLDHVLAKGLLSSFNPLSSDVRRFVVLGVALEENREAALRDVLRELECIIGTGVGRLVHQGRQVDSEDDEVATKAYVSSLITETMPFGVPLQTLPHVICNDFISPSTTDGKCSLPSTAGRALPSWFPGTVQSHEKALQRIASTILGVPDVVMWLEDSISAVLYRHEPEFRMERDVGRFWDVQTTIKCISHLRHNTEVMVLVATKQEPFAVHETVQRVEKSTNDVRLFLVPPPFLDPPERSTKHLDVARFRQVSTTSTPTDLGSKSQSIDEDNEEAVVDPLAHLPIHVTVRLRQANVTERKDDDDFNTYQVVVKVTAFPDKSWRSKVKIKNLVVRLIMPSFNTVVQLQTQASSGEVTFRNNIVRWDLDASIVSSSGTALLTGMITCSKTTLSGIPDNCNFTLFGETCCALVDFTMQGSRAIGNPFCELRSLEVANRSVSIDQELRTTTSGCFVVWNPFGDFIKGVPVEVVKSWFESE